MILPSARIVNLGGAFTSTLLVASSFYLEYVLYLQPCSLCILQRILYILLAAILLLAYLHHPKQRGIQVYGSLTLFLASLGVFLAGRQVWLQSLPHAPTEICLPGFSYIISHLPLHQALSAMLLGSDNCGVVDWTVCGWSLACWSLLFFILFCLLGIYQTIGGHSHKLPAK